MVTDAACERNSQCLEKSFVTRGGNVKKECSIEVVER